MRGSGTSGAPPSFVPPMSEIVFHAPATDRRRSSERPDKFDTRALERWENEGGSCASTQQGVGARSSEK